MCVVSNILDYGRQTWPQPDKPKIDPYFSPYQWPNWDATTRTPTAKEWQEFLELVEKARKFDEIARQLDCEDPTKLEWFEAMKTYMESQQFDDPDSDSSATKL